MNCKPNELAYVINCEGTRDAGIDGRFVTVTSLTLLSDDGRNQCWEYEGPRLFVAKTGSVINGLSDRILRPIRDPGDDARDESLDWLPVPSKEVA